MYRNKKQSIMDTLKKITKFRILAVHENGEESTFFRPTLQSSLNFVRDCFVRHYPSYYNVIYYIQQFNESINDYISLITCDYYYSDLPF